MKKRRPKNTLVEVKNLFNRRKYSDVVRYLAGKKDLSSELHLYLSNAYMKLGKTAEGYKQCQLAIEKNPEDARAWKFMASIEYASGHLEKVVEALARASELDPENVNTKINLGEFLRVGGLLDDALEVYESIRLTGKESKDLLLMYYVDYGVCLRDNGRKEEALEQFKKVLELDANNPQGYINIAGLYLEKREIERAAPYVFKSYELDPENENILSSAAVYFQASGEVEKSVEFVKKALAIKCRKYPAGFMQRKKGYMNTSIAKEALHALHEAIEKLQIQYFLAFGTLLGIVRDGDLLPHDKDMDIGVPFELPRPQLFAALDRFGFECGQKDKLLNPNTYNISVTHKASKIPIDLFFFKRTESGFVTGIDTKPVALTWSFPYFKLEYCRWRDKLWLIPHEPEVFLATTYGANWKVPDPYFDTVVSGCNRNRESDPVALAYAYTRMYDRIERQEWQKALGYCRQILRVREDQFVHGLIGWLEQRESELHAQS